jgi:hypothetical protein
MASCPSRTRHQFIPSLYSIHVITHSRMLSTFTRGTVLLPNDDVLPTADASTERFKENLLPNGALLPNSAHMPVSSPYQFLVLTLSILILSKTYPSDNYFPNSRHERLLATGFLLLKSNKEYVLTFKILAQVLVGLIFTKLAI